MKLNSGRIIQVILFFFSFFLIIYTYYYLPNKNQGFIKVETKEEIKLVEETKSKNTFKNIEYVNSDKEGNKYTTRAKKSFFIQNEPDLIYLNDVHSFTTLKKDNSLVNIYSKRALFDKKINEIKYEKDVMISNKSYVITAQSARQIPSKNIIIIDENVIMKDLAGGLSHIIYCDTVEIDTTTNDVLALMKDKNKKVLVEKYK